MATPTSAQGLPWLVGDIGGTNARLGWVTRAGGPVEQVRTLPVAAHATPADAVRAYLAGLGPEAGTPRRAALAVATAVGADEVVLTNSAWRFSCRALQSALGLERLLVLNDFEALALSLPLVALWTSALMLLGGMLAARAQMGLDPAQFLHTLPRVVEPANLWLGWVKSMIFGGLIALLASHFGLRVKPNTESLGQSVTQSVVTAITLVIVVDAVFAVLFSNVGI